MSFFSDTQRRFSPKYIENTFEARSRVLAFRSLEMHLSRAIDLVSVRTA